MFPNILGSKSILQRVMVLSAHSKADITLQNYNPCADVLEMEAALKEYGYETEAKEDGMHFRFSIVKHEASSHRYRFQESATAFRLWLSLAANLKGARATIELSEILCKRGYAPLQTALEAMGAVFGIEDKLIRLRSCRLSGGKTQIDGSISSQYHSSLILAAPFMQEELLLPYGPAQVSLPYLKLSIQILRSFGAKICKRGDYLRISRGKLCIPEHFRVDSDASTAAYYAALGALRPQGIQISLALDPAYTQADMMIFDILADMGANVHWSDDICTITPGRLISQRLDLKDAPDLMPILSILALFCEGQTVVTGIARLARKESNRVLGIRRALDRIGVKYEYGDDFLKIYPIADKDLLAVQLDTQYDHRLVMAFSLLRYRYPQISLTETASLKKSIAYANLGLTEP